jgi:hypothetical protein
MSKKAQLADAKGRAYAKSLLMPFGAPAGPSKEQVAQTDTTLIKEIRKVLKKPPPPDLTSVPEELTAPLEALIRQVGGFALHTSWRRIGMDGTTLAVTGTFTRKQTDLEMQDVLNAMRDKVREHFADSKIASYNISDAVRPRMKYDPTGQTLTLNGKFTALLEGDSSSSVSRDDESDE